MAKPIELDNVYFRIGDISIHIGKGKLRSTKNMYHLSADSDISIIRWIAGHPITKIQLRDALRELYENTLEDFDAKVG